MIDALEVSGGPHDIGYAYGSACKQLIAQALKGNYSYYAKYTKFTKASVLRLARKYTPFIVNYAPELEEEIAGISEGAGITQEEVVMLATYYEIMYHYAGLGMGCTAIAVTGTATANGETFVAQTNDEALEPWGQDFSRIVYARPRSGPEYLTYTYPGFPGQMGVNSKGIAQCANALITPEYRIGVPVQVITREILQQASIGDALDAIRRAKRASSVNFLIADENGEIYDMEATPTSYDCFYSSERMVHTNYFLSRRLGVKKDVILENLIDPVIRYNRMNRILKEIPRQATAKDLMEAFKDHVNYPNSICRHPNERLPPKDRMRTADCMIFSATKKSMWLANGNPCQAEFQALTMR